MRYLISILILIGCCPPSSCLGQVRPIDTGSGKATATCIGETPDGSFWVTAGHCLERAEYLRIWSKSRQEWCRCSNIGVDMSCDLAWFEAPFGQEPLPLFEGSLSSSETLEVPGYGPDLFSGRTERPSLYVRHAQLLSQETAAQLDSQVIPGDSGCPLVYQGRTVGIVVGFDKSNPRQTVLTSARQIHNSVSRYWNVQCPPGGCPVYIRPRGIRQPVFSIPIGPPQLISEIVPAQPQSSPPVSGVPGPRGPAGERGPAGPPGESVSREHVEAVIAAWLDANADKLRGPAGPTGERGLIGVPSEEELQAVIDTWVSRNDNKIRQMIRDIVQEMVESRVTALEGREIEVILAKDKKPIDREVYRNGKPIILNLNRIQELMKQGGGSPDAR